MEEYITIEVQPGDFVLKGSDVPVIRAALEAYRRSLQDDPFLSKAPHVTQVCAELKRLIDLMK